jgi:hypothetical protein
LAPGVDEAACDGCGRAITWTHGAADEGQIHRCIACGSRDIYARKDFPQRLGVLIVVLGFAASSVTWAYSQPIWTFAILFATALIDVVLYLLMPTALVCYHCGALYRNATNQATFDGFDLETHERHRQQRMRVAQIERSQETRSPIREPAETQ